MKMELQMRQKTDKKDSINSFHCTLSSISFQNVLNNKNDFQSLDKLVNAGGFDEMDALCALRYIRYTEGVTLLGGGCINPKLGEARYSDISTGIGDYYEKSICISTKNNGNWL